MFLDKITDALNEKREWNQMQKRAKQLPKEFYKAYKALEKYMFNMGVADWHIFYEIIELFEFAVLDGRTVSEVLGEDYATFADDLLNNKKEDWQQKYRVALNDYFAHKSENKELMTKKSY